jgi:hypothetical protein
VIARYVYSRVATDSQSTAPQLLVLRERYPNAGYRDRAGNGSPSVSTSGADKRLPGPFGNSAA